MWEAAYRAHSAGLLRLAFLLTGSRAVAEDAVHEVFAKCATRIPALDHPASYLRAALVNECRAHHRRLARLARPTREMSTDLPYEAVQTREALARLSERRRAAVVLRYFVDLPDEEIASILGCRPATVRSLVHRGLTQLRKELE